MLCSRLFNSYDTVIHLTQKMVALAQYYRFDGWLVNIENSIDVSYANSFGTCNFCEVSTFAC